MRSEKEHHHVLGKNAHSQPLGRLTEPPKRGRRPYGGEGFAGTGIRVNVLSASPTLTELAAEVVGRNAMIEMGATTPVGHVGEPSEVAAAAAFLASSDSNFMTGSELFTDAAWRRFEEVLQPA